MVAPRLDTFEKRLALPPPHRVLPVERAGHQAIEKFIVRVFISAELWASEKLRFGPLNIFSCANNRGLALNLKGGVASGGAPAEGCRAKSVAHTGQALHVLVYAQGPEPPAPP
jgi:hypothetical protein